MWEQIIGSFATLTIVLTLVGIIFKMKNKEIDTMKIDFKDALKETNSNLKQGLQDIRSDFTEALTILHDKKLNKESFEIQHAAATDKFDMLFAKVDTCIDKISEVATCVKIIEKGVNGKSV